MGAREVLHFQDYPQTLTDGQTLTDTVRYRRTSINALHNGFNQLKHNSAVDGSWSSWPSGDCGTAGVTCIGGSKIRTRTCSNPRPANGGRDCKGPFKETVDCNTQDCPGTGIQI